MCFKIDAKQWLKVTSLLYCIGSLWLTALVGIAQEKPSTLETKLPNRLPEDTSFSTVLAEASVDYRISPGDVIDIQVTRAPELSGTFRVTADGTIDMYYLGKLGVQEKTSEELARAITESLRGRYLTNPRVTVAIKQINSHIFFIQGAVNRPGAYQMEGRPSLLKLITIAGGLTEKHGSIAFIIRHATTGAGTKAGDEVSSRTRKILPTRQPPVDEEAVDSDGYELLKVNINGLFKGDFDKNMYVEPGSIVTIPQAEVFYVAGEVARPGSFEHKEGTTLRQAISLAAGTTFKASLGRGVIFRDNPDTKQREEIKVDIAEVMNGKKPDLEILANDVIIVPNSRMKSVTQSLLSALGVNSARLPTSIYR